VVAEENYLVRRAKFLRFQNWNMNTAHDIIDKKKKGSARNCNELQED